MMRRRPSFRRMCLRQSRLPHSSMWCRASVSMPARSRAVRSGVIANEVRNVALPQREFPSWQEQHQALTTTRRSGAGEVAVRSAQHARPVIVVCCVLPLSRLPLRSRLRRRPLQPRGRASPGRVRGRTNRSAD